VARDATFRGRERNHLATPECWDNQGKPVGEAVADSVLFTTTNVEP